MAKVKLAGSAGSKKTKTGLAADIRGALPCLFLVLLGIGLLMVIFYFSLQTANP